MDLYGPQILSVMLQCYVTVRNKRSDILQLNIYYIANLSREISGYFSNFTLYGTLFCVILKKPIQFLGRVKNSASCGEDGQQAGRISFNRDLYQPGSSDAF